MQQLEARRHESPSVKALWTAMPFCEWTLIREMLMQIAEVHVTFVPGMTMRMLKSMLGGVGTSLQCEMFFNRVRAAERAQNL